MFYLFSYKVKLLFTLLRGCQGNQVCDHGNQCHLNDSDCQSFFSFKIMQNIEGF